MSLDLEKKPSLSSRLPFSMIVTSSTRLLNTIAQLLFVVIEECHHSWGDRNLGAPSWVVMVQSLILDMALQALDTTACPTLLCDSVCKFCCNRIHAFVSPRPARQPLRNGRKLASGAVPPIVRNRCVRCTMRLQDGQRGLIRVAVGIASQISVKRRGGPSEGGKVFSVGVRASQGVDKASTVGVTRGVDSCLIEAELALHAVHKVGGELEVAHAGDGVRWTLPTFLLYEVRCMDFFLPPWF